ncbi:hypothetical protein K9N68_14050 [Kovacikia minuta CCNUW1]|uniref:hypothetical protein n=1 Tax=Kovacikia minuta TaxID=2931930 RepID=UPI001CCF20A7|nr:hypothetical protein [Kovacikia minuta]UBF28859.1 hypothetical protein K9N68_14050 [Kovacikia minuta CCNUW1]
MGKKRFEEVEYDPIETEAKRALARAVSQPGIGHQEGKEIIGEGSTISVPTDTSTVSLIEAARKKRATVIDTTQKASGRLTRKEKKRSFSCADEEQDRDLDLFIARLKSLSGTHLPFQVLMRAACVCVMRAEEQIVDAMRKMPPPVQPATFAHDAYAQFEEYWIELLGIALRRVRPHQ